MPDASKNIAIGLLVTLALGLILWVLLFLHPSFGDGNFRLHVRFSDIEKVNVGTRITYAGRPVGEVVKISQVPEEERQGAQDPNEIYIYDLSLAIDSHIPLYDCDEITIGTSGLMGERFISIVPKRPKNHVARPIAFNEVVYSTNPKGMNDAFETVCRVADKAEETMTVLSALLSNVAQGKGSLGKLIVSDDFYCKTVGIMNKMDVLMNDVNHYGVLYHLDKGWQRDRRRQVEEIAALQSPKQFKSYMDQEMFKITNSLSRLGMALDKAEHDAPLATNKEFGRTFNEVLAQLQDLQATLKNYSIEIADTEQIAQEKNKE